MQDFCYGIIEGFYGHPWSWDARRCYANFLKQHEFSFYIYAPKSDAYLRKQWQQDWPNDQFQQLLQLSQSYQEQQVDFGIALSPYELYQDWNQQTRAQLKKKIQRINELEPQVLCVLFDDMRGDWPDLAKTQVEICHFIQELSTSSQQIMCPTYYSYEPVLEELFGQRPDDYWHTLGQELDARIEVFWTGDLVCSTRYDEGCFDQINHALQRKVSLWDNYPVNDGRKTSPFLHLKAFENRPASNAQHLRRHAVNPMNAAFLSQIPLISLADTYHSKVGYNAQQSQHRALREVCGDSLGGHIEQHIEIFQALGMEKLPPDQKQSLLTIYQQFDHPCSEEICLWLNDYYQFDPECLTG